MRALGTALAGLVLGLCSHVGAQASLVPNTGCGKNPIGNIKWSGTGQIGTTFLIKSKGDSATDLSSMLMGLPSPLQLLPQPIACLPNCNLSIVPLASVAGGGQFVSISVPVPNNPSLVGAVVGFQGASLDVNQNCFQLTAGVKLQIQ